MNLDVASSVKRFPVIFDSGASIAITGDRSDFVGPLRAPPAGLTIGGMARGAAVEGIGLVKWKFKTSTGAMILSVTCYYVPACSARLLSPQRLFNKKKGIAGSFSVEEDHATLLINENPPFIIDYDSTTFLPVGLASNAAQSPSIIQPNVNLCITEDANQNLTSSQKLLLTWHYRFGHRNLPFVQHLLRLPVFGSDKFLAAAKAELPKCAICEYAKGHLRSTVGNCQTTNPDTDGALKEGQLRPGAKVSADHFESRLKGRTYSSFGKTTSDQYVGGCIFVDHMSGFIHVEHQLGFSSSETIRDKQDFEQLALGHGVLVEDYLTDNGIFSKTKFVDHIRQHNQQIHYCGVNAHHKNAIAERAIRTVSELTRALLLHASTHWPEGINGALWPMAVDHAVHLYNTLPNRHGVCPLDLFSGTTIPRHKLVRELHVWGCPVYLFDPTLQQGKKLPRWQPRSRRGVFLG
jgi:Integrase core domain.